jgi:hypothetical protein
MSAMSFGCIQCGAPPERRCIDRDGELEQVHPARLLQADNIATKVKLTEAYEDMAKLAQAVEVMSTSVATALDSAERSIRRLKGRVERLERK